MASKNTPYLTKQVTTGPLRSTRKLTKLLSQGWEQVASRTIGMSGLTEHTLRFPNPKYKGLQK